MSVRRNWKVLALAGVGAGLVAALAVGLFVVRGTGATTPDDPARGALSLSGTDPITGKAISLASFRGKPVVLNVWASWCEGCRDEARDLVRFARDHPEAQLVGLDTQDNAASAKAFYSLYGWTHPSIADTNGVKAGQLELQGLPSTFFLDPEGRVVSRIVGASNYAGFTNGLRAAKR